MHIVAVAWMFVVLLMTLAEATSTQGTLLGAFFTLLLYGLLPLAIVLYLMGTPSRRRARRAAEAREAADLDMAAPPAAASAADGHRSGQPPGAGLAAERKEP